MLQATPLVSEVFEFSTKQLYYFSSNYTLPDGQHPIYSEPKVAAKQTGSIKVTERSCLTRVRRLLTWLLLSRAARTSAGRTCHHGGLAAAG